MTRHLAMRLLLHKQNNMLAELDEIEAQLVEERCEFERCLKLAFFERLWLVMRQVWNRLRKSIWG